MPSMSTISRRAALRRAAAGLAAVPACGWLPGLAAAADRPERRGSCILLWMAGGPSQTDTFDPKPGHANGGPSKAIQTATAGVRFGEHLPKLAALSNKLAVVRSMKTKEGDHGRATFQLRTGYVPQAGISFPALGALVANENDKPRELPGYVSIAPPRSFAPESVSPGFLGPRFAPLHVGARDSVDGYQTDGGGGLRVQDVDPPAGVTAARVATRRNLLAQLDSGFAAERPGAAIDDRQAAYEQAIRLMRPEVAEAFDLAKEPAKLRDAYGRHRFGQGCLLARRLVERNVPFVEVVLGGWDTHEDNFDHVQRLCNVVDPAWSTLLTDLETRGLAKNTLVVWMGEFGRTPNINPRNGRDHFPQAWSAVLSGGGVRGGSVVGKTSDDGSSVIERPVAVGDLLATILLSLGLDPMKQNMSNVSRPIRLADPDAKPLREIVA